VAEGRVSGGPKKVAAEQAHLVLIDETGLFLNPLVRRSWSPIGHTPIVGGDGGHRRKVSVIGAVSVSPDAHRLGFYFATAVDGYFGPERVVAFLRDLLRHLRGKVVVLWDAPAAAAEADVVDRLGPRPGDRDGLPRATTPGAEPEDPLGR
jgi:hypothetical protein